MAAGYTYTVEKECPVCKEKTKITKTRMRLNKRKQDIDFCTYYQDFNPYYYTIWTCSHCGFAEDEAHFSLIPERNREKLANFLKGKNVKLEYKEIRQWEDAVATFKLAIFFADMIQGKDSHMAGLYLKLAWLYRESDDQEQERACLEKSVEHYDRSLVKERYPIGPMTDVMVTYLIGTLYYKLDNIDKATVYLSKVIGDERARHEANIYNMARDLWQIIRKEKDQQRQETNTGK